MEYIVKETGHDSFAIVLNGFILADIYFKSENASTPVTKEVAENWANLLKITMESHYPVSELDEDDFQPSEFEEVIESMIDGGADKEDVFKMMMLGALLS